MEICLFIGLFVVGATRTIEYSDESIRFRREVLGNGLKKEINSVLQVIGECVEVVVIERVPKDWFVDVEEISTSMHPVFDGGIDIEKPAALSRDHVFNVSFPCRREIQYTYPIHLRYSDPSWRHEYRDVKLPGPLIQIKEKIIEIKEDMEFKVAVGYLPHTFVVTLVTIMLVLLAGGLVIYTGSPSKSSIKV